MVEILSVVWIPQTCVALLGSASNQVCGVGDRPRYNPAVNHSSSTSQPFMTEGFKLGSFADGVEFGQAIKLERAAGLVEMRACFQCWEPLLATFRRR